MTDKRFTVNYRENTRLYEVKDRLHKIDCGSWAFEYGAKQCCEELNELAEENKLHKERILLLSSLLDLADAIIDTSDNEKAKQVWDNKNEQTEKEWERILN